MLGGCHVPPARAPGSPRAVALGSPPESGAAPLLSVLQAWFQLRFLAGCVPMLAGDANPLTSFFFRDV